MEFKDRLIELRKSSGWSQEELGDKLEVTRQTVSKYILCIKGRIQEPH
jgi:transcriptional regulator with XRE-family HTH domain